MARGAYYSEFHAAMQTLPLQSSYYRCSRKHYNHNTWMAKPWYSAQAMCLGKATQGYKKSSETQMPLWLGPGQHPASSMWPQ